MGMSLAFHIVFANVGIAMPLVMVIAEWLHLRTDDEVYHTLARRWAVGTAIICAVGAGRAPCFLSSSGFCGHAL
jgi:cytochrome d ubiquinol oxidase subunit I